MAILPRVLKNFTAFIDGRGYLGRTESVQLPNLTTNNMEFRDGGMDFPIDIDMGIGKLDVEIVLAGYDRNVIKLWGLFSNDTPIVLRGALQRQGNDAVPMVVRMTGRVTSLNRAQWQGGQNSNMTLVVNCISYKEEIAGETVIDIDGLNFRRVIGGVDQLAGIRAALGA